MAKASTHFLVVKYRSGRKEEYPFSSLAAAEKERANVAMVKTVIEAKVVLIETEP